MTAPPDHSPVWDHLDALCDGLRAGHDEATGEIAVQHGRLVRLLPGKTVIPSESVDALTALGWVDLIPAGEDFVALPTSAGKYQRTKWHKRVYKAHKRGAA